MSTSVGPHSPTGRTSSGVAPKPDGSEPRPVHASASRGRWAPSIFSIVPDGAIRRRPSDLVRVGLATVFVAVLVVLARDGSVVGKDVYEFLADLPHTLDGFLQITYDIALVGFLIAIVAAAVFARRWRFVVTMALAAVAAALLAVAIDRAVGASVLTALTAAGADISGTPPAFPPVLLTVALAVIFAGLAYLTRPVRRLALVLILLAILSALGTLAGLPLSILTAWALAWGVAGLVRFGMGTPAGTPSVGEVREALTEMGVAVDDLGLAPEQVWGETRFVGHDGDRTISVTTIGRDATDARFFAKLIRAIWYKDSGSSLLVSRAVEVEHRGFLLLLADRAGVRVPDLLGAGREGDLGHALVVTAEPPATLLADVDPESLADHTLVDLWRNVARLHTARLAHGSLHGGTVLVLADGTTMLRDFARTTVGAPRERQLLDNADVLVASAALVGVERAVEVAASVIGEDGVGELLPVLQPSALSWGTRHQVPEVRKLVTAVREGTAGYLGQDVPALVELRRVSPTTLLMAIGAAFGVYLLVGELASVADMGDVFAGASWGWVVATAIIAQTPQFASAVAMLGSVSVRLPYGPVLAVQFANNFTGLVAGTVGTTAMVVRFFQKQGQTISVAVSSGILNTLGAMTAEVVLVVVGLALTASDFSVSGSSGNRSSSSSGSAVGAVLVLCLVGVLVVVFVPRLRRQVSAKVKPQAEAARANLHEISANPRKPLELFFGNLLSQLFFALTLQAALHAYGASLPLLQLVVINSLASLLGGLLPVPGGLGVIEAGLIAGFTAAGIPEHIAVAATFTARMFTAYLPPIWGWYALRWLGNHDYV